VPRSVFDAVFLSAFIYFLAQVDLGFEISEIQLSIGKGSLTGKAVVPKTIARLSLAGSTPVPSAKFGPVAQWNESATLRRSRAYVQIVPGPPLLPLCNLCVLCVSVVSYYCDVG
jgi:hypothetical protein